MKISKLETKPTSWKTINRYYMIMFGEATIAAKMASPLVAAKVPQNTAVTSEPWV